MRRRCGCSARTHQARTIRPGCRSRLPRAINTFRLRSTNMPPCSPVSKLARHCASVRTCTPTWFKPFAAAGRAHPGHPLVRTYGMVGDFHRSKLFAFADFGFAAACRNDMTISVPGRPRRRRRNVSCVRGPVALPVLLVVCALVYIIPIALALLAGYPRAIAYGRIDVGATSCSVQNR